ACDLALLAVGDLRERALLPAALPGAGRHAAAHPGLCGAVHRLEHGVLDRRLRLWSVPAAAAVHSLGVRLRWQADQGAQGLGGGAWLGVGATDAGPVPLLEHPAVGCHDRTRSGALMAASALEPAPAQDQAPQTPGGDRRRGIVITTVVASMVAIIFYIGF